MLFSKCIAMSWLKDADIRDIRYNLQICVNFQRFQLIYLLVKHSRVDIANGTKSSKFTTISLLLCTRLHNFFHLRCEKLLISLFLLVHRLWTLLLTNKRFRFVIIISTYGKLIFEQNYDIIEISLSSKRQEDNGE